MQMRSLLTGKKKQQQKKTKNRTFSTVENLESWAGSTLLHGRITKPAPPPTSEILIERGEHLYFS